MSELMWPSVSCAWEMWQSVWLKGMSMWEAATETSGRARSNLMPGPSNPRQQLLRRKMTAPKSSWQSSTTSTRSPASRRTGVLSLGQPRTDSCRQWRP